MAADVFLRLRWKLSLSILLVLSLVLFIIIGSFNLYLVTANKQEASRFMDNIASNGGLGGPGDFRLAEKLPGEQPDRPLYKPAYKPDMFEGRTGDIGQKSALLRFLETFYPFKTSFVGFRNFFSAYVTADGDIEQVISPFANSVSEESEKRLVSHIVSLGRDRGMDSGFSWRITKYEGHSLLIILDRANEVVQERRFALVSVMFFLVSLCVSFLLAWLFSKWAVRPVQEAFVKQKQFIADASHELKTPIAVIGANIDVLEQDPLLQDNKWLGYIKTENARMGSLVKDMLYLAKDDAGKTEYARLPFDLCDSVGCAVLPFESVAFEQGKKLEMQLPHQIIPMLGDEAKIRQAVIILTDNALKNSEKGALIRVSAAQEGSRCWVKVYNTGMGISAADRAKIFNRFYRSDASRARATGGYGLGLAIAQSIVQGHHGKISVASEPGSYAEFTITLPCSDGHLL